MTARPVAQRSQFVMLQKTGTAVNRSLPITFAVLSILTVVGGCSNIAQPSSSEGSQSSNIVIDTTGSDGNVRIDLGDGDSGNRLSANGMTISYPESYVRKDFAVEDDNVRIDFKGHRLEIKEGSLLFDETEFGTVRKGDRIEIREDGSVVINSETVTSS